MFEALGAILVVVSMVTGSVSFIAMFKPRPRLWLTTRNRAVVVWLASFALLFLGAALVPEPSPEEQAAAERRDRQEQQERARVQNLREREQAQAENLRERQERADSARGGTVVVCENRMTSQLRAPGTADYPFGHVANVQDLGNDRYRLRSYVDAENAFGGEVRTNFVCVVEVSGSGEDVSNYRIVEFDAQ